VTLACTLVTPDLAAGQYRRSIVLERIMVSRQVEIHATILWHFGEQKLLIGHRLRVDT
jgi:hypothetical protein